MGDKLNWRSELLISFFTFPWIVKKHVRPLTICRKSCHSNCYVNSAAIARIRAVGNVTSSRHAHFCWPEDQNHQHGTQMSASRRKHTELGKVTIRSLLQTPKASERLLCEAICSCVFDYAQLDFDTMVLFLHWILYNVKNSEMLRGSPCVWRELAREREFFFLPDFTFSLTNRAFLFISSPLSSPLYCCVSPLSSHSFSPSDHTHTHAHTHCTCIISVAASNGLQAQARTGLTAVGLISRNTWWVPTLMPGLIYQAWDCQQPPSDRKTCESHSRLYCFLRTRELRRQSLSLSDVPCASMLAQKKTNNNNNNNKKKRAVKYYLSDSHSVPSIFIRLVLPWERLAK